MKMELVELLKEIKENKFKFDDKIDKSQLAQDLLKNIGNHDSFIRDGLIYPTLANLLYYDNLPKEEMIEITRTLMGEKGMKFDMPNYYDFSVLTRSWSLLALVIIVYRQRNDKILPDELFNKLYIDFLDYFNNETDFRGYVDEVGWAHSVAHSADLFNQFFKCNELGEKEFKTMFEHIKNRFMINTYVFISDEDERMVTAIVEAISRDVLSKEFLLEWINGFKSFEKLAKFPEDYNVDINIRNLLRSLYFRLRGNSEYQYLLEALEKVLDELNTHIKK